MACLERTGPQPGFAGSLNALIRREYEKRGMLWVVVGSVLGLVIGALALL